MSKALNYEEVKIIKDKMERPKLRISLLLDHFQSDDNVAHVFRLADSFDIDHIYLWNDNDKFNWPIIQRKSRSCSKHISYTLHESLDVLLMDIKAQMIGLEWTNSSSDINNFKHVDQDIILVLGNESKGISTELLARCESYVHVPMYGKNSSMNVAMAAAICVHTLLHK